MLNELTKIYTSVYYVTMNEWFINNLWWIAILGVILLFLPPVGIVYWIIIGLAFVGMGETD